MSIDLTRFSTKNHILESLEQEGLWYQVWAWKQSRHQDNYKYKAYRNGKTWGTNKYAMALSRRP